MLFITFFQWWMTDGWSQQTERTIQVPKSIASSFDIGGLLKTLFAPWKRTISYAGKSRPLGDKMRALIDNAISRFVGFWVRISALLFAVLLLGLSFVVNGLLTFVWPLVIFIPPTLLIIGVLAI